MIRLKQLFALFLLSVLAIGCSQEDVKFPDEKSTVEVSFSFDRGELLPETKTPDDSPYPRECPNNDDLRFLSENGNLKASVSLKWFDNGNMMTTTEHLPVYWVDDMNLPMQGRFVTKALPLSIPNTYTVEQFTIYDTTDPQNYKLLYSALGADSPLAGHADEAVLLPREYQLDLDDLYKKITFDMTVFCVEKHDVTDFGFVMWNVEFIRMYLLPFAVNVCDENNVDIVGEGYITYETGTMENGLFVPDGVVYDPINFPDGDNLAYFIFTDNLHDPNDQEYFRYRIKINNVTPAREYWGVISVEDLLRFDDPTYEESVWVAEFNFLHFWFCSGMNRWFFGPIV